MRITDVIQLMEEIAPAAYQESYDNAGLIVGDKEMELKGILICLDSTEEVLQEALAKGYNMIIAHHPILFSPLKKLSGDNYVERTLRFAIKNDLAIFAIHTNLDNVAWGVNRKICEVIGLEKIKILSLKSNNLMKLVAFMPHKDAERVCMEVFSAGGGKIGNYDQCSFTIDGKGGFRPNENANPVIGTKGTRSIEAESRIEIIIPKHLTSNIIQKLKSAHPYEEVAYYVSQLENPNQETGAGMIGELEMEMDEMQFLNWLKDVMNLKVIRHTALMGKKIKKVAVCGGSGSFLLQTAKQQQADIFITADFKYHEFFDADKHIVIADIGHYESEVYTNNLLYDILIKKLSTFAISITEINTNPVRYLV